MSFDSGQPVAPRFAAKEFVVSAGDATVRPRGGKLDKRRSRNAGTNVHGVIAILPGLSRSRRIEGHREESAGLAVSTAIRVSRIIETDIEGRERTGKKVRLAGAKSDEREGGEGENVLARTNRTFSGLSRNNAAFNNGCLVPSDERQDRVDIRAEGRGTGRDGQRRRNEKEAGNLVVPGALPPVPVAFQKLPCHSTRASLIEVDDIRPVCLDFLHATC